MNFKCNDAERNGMHREDIVDHSQGSFGPFGPKSAKRQKGVRGLSARGLKSQIKNRLFFKFFSGFTPLLDSFLTFWGPRVERPGNPFRDCFGTSGRRASMTPVNGQ